jgi:hypothetical protein
MKEIEAFIMSHPSDNFAEVSREVSDKFNRFIPAPTVQKIMAKRVRAEHVTRAKDAASSTLEDNVVIVEDVKAKLRASFDDKSLVLKDRIEAAKELRQWVKLGMDMSGIHDAEDDTLFVVGSDWDVMPRASN